MTGFWEFAVILAATITGCAIGWYARESVLHRSGTVDFEEEKEWAWRCVTACLCEIRTSGGIHPHRLIELIQQIPLRNDDEHPHRRGR